MSRTQKGPLANCTDVRFREELPEELKLIVLARRKIEMGDGM